MKSFIKMDNDILLSTEDYNFFTQVGTEGFALYTYLLTVQGSSSYCSINIRMISEFLNRDYESRPKVKYGKVKNKQFFIGTTKGKMTIHKYLKLLNDKGYIEICNELKSSINHVIIIKVKKCERVNNFTLISEELFVDYIHKIGHIGWSLLYILTNRHNSNFGGVQSQGFANPTEEYLSKIIKRDIDTIRAYLYLLQKQKLIKIEKQQPILRGVDKNGRDTYEFIPNHYIVRNRDSDNKYYLN